MRFQVDYDLDGMDLTLLTSLHNDMDKTMTVIVREVIHLKEEIIKDQLVKLGWTPPCNMCGDPDVEEHRCTDGAIYQHYSRRKDPEGWEKTFDEIVRTITKENLDEESDLRHRGQQPDT